MTRSTSPLLPMGAPRPHQTGTLGKITMTLSMAWVRTLTPNVQELVFCSDSRLSGGNRFDHAAKLFTLPRSDCGLAFAGGTYWAYPMAIALARATELHAPSATRAMELSKYLTHLIKILNQMQAAVHTFAEGENVPNATFLFGGWDWIGKRYRLWKLIFDPKEMTFGAHERRSSNRFGRLGLIEFAGDAEFVEKARIRLKKLAQERYGKDMRGGKARFDFEPLEVMRDILREIKPNDTVGGAPQLMKVYQHMNTRMMGVFWGQGTKRNVYYCGRPLLGYERADGLWVIDPDTLRSSMIGLPSADEGSGDEASETTG